MPTPKQPIASVGKPLDPLPLVSVNLLDDWRIWVTATTADGKDPAAELAVPPPELVAVLAERHDRLPPFNHEAWGGWLKGAPLDAVRAQECTAKGALDPASLQVRGVDHGLLQRGKDYQADLDWGTIGRLDGGRIAADQPVWIGYRYGKPRLDSLVLEPGGIVTLKRGDPDVARPQPPQLAEGETRLANIFVEGRLDKLGPEHLFPILETAYPEQPNGLPLGNLLPKTLAKLRNGDALRLLAWGDSVTDGGYLPHGETDRWQNQFVRQLQSRFPASRIELTTEAWPGYNTAAYLAEPPGSLHNYQEKVLGSRPDLIVSEFVNDAGLTPPQVDERYSQLLAEFTAIGAEWIILTPHYVRPDWMGLPRQRQIDTDPRPYVQGLREFARKRRVALADASRRWGRLWRQGIPYNTLMHNTINHPDGRGMKLFADSLMALFS